ncbi:MAG: hypothetical protein KAU90_01835 [Sulfurovaceae bacterium]|nr:hypothetical protein [Sulfurovaceae bacterium]
MNEIIEEIRTLRNASYFLDNATRIFIEDNNKEGCYNDDITKRFDNGLSFIHELMDKKYKKIQEKLHTIS